MPSILLLASFTPIFIILIGVLLLLNLDERINRNLLSTFLLGIALLLNTMLLIFYMLLDLRERSFALNFEPGTFFIFEIIMLLGLFTLMFTKHEMMNVVNERQMNSIIFLILLSLIGTVLTSNILITITCFSLALFFIGAFFYFGEFTKDFELLQWYFIGVGISVILLFFGSFFMIVETGTLLLTEILFLDLSPVSNFFITSLFILGFGIPCGLFPFFIFHLKNYFQDSSYSSLILYFNLISLTPVILLRSLSPFSFNHPPNGIFLLFVSTISLIISLIYILTELFTSLDGDTFSIKKIYGFSLCADFNMTLLFISYLTILNPLNNSIVYLNNVLFFLFSLTTLKILLLFSFFPIMLETFDDNFKLLGNFHEKYQKFSYIYPLSGIILSFPISFIFLNNIMSIFSEEIIISNSLYASLAFLMIGLFLFYLAINLILISTIYIQVYYGNVPRYIERDTIPKVKMVHFRPLIFIFFGLGLIIMLGLLDLLQIFGNPLFQIFKRFFLFIN